MHQDSALTSRFRREGPWRGAGESEHHSETTPARLSRLGLCRLRLVGPGAFPMGTSAQAGSNGDQAMNRVAFLANYRPAPEAAGRFCLHSAGFFRRASEVGRSFEHRLVRQQPGAFMDYSLAEPCVAAKHKFAHSGLDRGSHDTRHQLRQPPLSSHHADAACNFILSVGAQQPITGDHAA